eukprot:3018781-Rhodomonas_salina.3
MLLAQERGGVEQEVARKVGAEAASTGSEHGRRGRGEGERAGGSVNDSEGVERQTNVDVGQEVDLKSWQQSWTGPR